MHRRHPAGLRTLTALGAALLLAAGCAESGASSRDEAAEADTGEGAAASDAADPAGDEQAVRAFLEGVYGAYAGPGAGQDFARPELLFDPELAQAIAAGNAAAEAQGGMPPVDADPFCGCQDWDPFEARISDLAVSGDTATADVSFTNFGEEVRKTLRLVRTPDGWRVADILDDGYSFRDGIL